MLAKQGAVARVEGKTSALLDGSTAGSALVDLRLIATEVKQAVMKKECRFCRWHTLVQRMQSPTEESENSRIRILFTAEQLDKFIDEGRRHIAWVGCAQ